ncbi:MAG: MMPL family transporter [Actinomycetota bacterium]|nr:MMPL family transporter [Actinomycetota bacterium]
MATIGRWSTRHPWRAIVAWLAFVVVAVAAMVATGTETLQNGAVGESARGYEMLGANNLWPPPREIGYLHSTTLTVDDPAFRAAVSDVVKRLGSQEVQITTPLQDARLVSRDRHSALVVATLTGAYADPVRNTILAAAPAHTDVTIEETGDITASDARDRSINDDLQRAEILSVPVTLFVLLFAFGAAVAASVPVLLALTAVAAAFGLLGPISKAIPIDDSVRTVLVLIGMAVGVDYALFYVMRSREERRRGRPPHEALERTIRTSGRTVILSGTTVIIAMAAMFLIEAKVFNSLAAATISVVACAVAGSVTVLPGVLELLGNRIDRGRIPFLPHLRTDQTHSRFWTAVIDRVLRRPVLSCVLSAGLLIALALPALGLKVAKPGDNTLSPQSIPELRALVDIRREFPGGAETAKIVATVPTGAAAALRRQRRRLEQLALARGIGHGPLLATSNDDGTAAALFLPLTGSGNNKASRRSILALRNELIPQTIGTIPGARTAVTGDVAEDVDFTRQLKHGLPFVLVFVLLLAFVLLLVAFRSIVVPLKAIVLNLLSVGASYGVLVLVFQHHWAEPLLGFTSNGAIISWLPLFLFVVLFGLSMDYHVFILSRVREGVDSGMKSDDAVRYGITATAGVVTSAALVMFAVFSIFGSLSSLDVKQAGVGLAAAVLIDATIVRAVLLPASMKLLGEWNWYLPRALERLPRAETEASPSRDPV